MYVSASARGAISARATQAASSAASKEPTTLTFSVPGVILLLPPTSLEVCGTRLEHITAAGNSVAQDQMHAYAQFVEPDELQRGLEQLHRPAVADAPKPATAVHSPPLAGLASAVGNRGFARSVARMRDGEGILSGGLVHPDVEAAIASAKGGGRRSTAASPSTSVERSATRSRTSASISTTMRQLSIERCRRGRSPSGAISSSAPANTDRIPPADGSSWRTS